MAYTPYEWTVNSYLNPTRMNAIEQGIAAASQAAESASGEFHTIEELIGTQSIAGIGDGTLTGATWKINNDLTELSATVTTLNSKLPKSEYENFSLSTLTFTDATTYKYAKVKDVDYEILSATIQGFGSGITTVPMVAIGSNGKSLYFIIDINATLSGTCGIKWTH